MTWAGNVVCIGDMEMHTKSWSENPKGDRMEDLGIDKKIYYSGC